MEKVEIEKFAVVVNNPTGQRLNIGGIIVKSLRETIGDQVFEFDTPQNAQSFANALNAFKKPNLSVLYAHEEEKESGLKTSEIDLEAQYKSMSVKDLKALCKKRSISNYSSLDEADLIATLIESDKETQK